MESTGQNNKPLRLLEIRRIPALEDNYIFLLVDTHGKTAAVVDPAEPQNVLAQLQQNNLKLTHIFNTHHHADHVGANKALLNVYPELVISAGIHDKGRIPGASRWLSEGDCVEFAGHIANVFFVPGHTRGHIAYFFSTLSREAHGEGDNLGNGNLGGVNLVADLFIGDTLFGGGCGKLFEGTYSEMLSSLQKIRALPDSTRVWCAHEYTQKNLEVAVKLGEKNEALNLHISRVKAARAQMQPTVPLNLGTEKATNPFLRWDSPQLQAALGTHSDLETFTYVRDFRDKF